MQIEKVAKCHDLNRNDQEIAFEKGADIELRKGTKVACAQEDKQKEQRSSVAFDHDLSEGKAD